MKQCEQHRGDGKHCRKRALSEVRELMRERMIGARAAMHVHREGPDPGDRSDQPECLSEFERGAERGSRHGPDLGEASQAQWDGERGQRDARSPVCRRGGVRQGQLSGQRNAFLKELAEPDVAP
jgi:hypothetical protein